MKKLVLLFALLAAPLATAQLLIDTPRGVVAAHDGRVELADRWRVDGVANATSIAASSDRVAVLDALHNEAVIVELASGRVTRVATAETPIAALFVSGELYVLARDARVLQHVGGASIPLAADPAFVRAANGRLYVYSRVDGVLEEIERDRVVRRATIAPFASDLEVDGANAYLLFPRDARVRVVDLRTLRVSDTLAAGAVPVDVALAGGGSALTAPILAVADPSAKRVWLTEGTQSMTQAVARGFLRGVLGLGLFANRSSEFPTGIDRVVARGSRWLAYDSSSGTLYRVTRQKSTVVATGIAPGAYALTAGGIAFWQNGRVRIVP
ncbi:MAG: hypothetical protein JO197_13060 [Acidobacteria bacterium]|nr:hypothetical protein [Acidobacteriota bacterium]MBV9478201.1 hypothetical protein [Acidobacteriota bacterium]